MAEDFRLALQELGLLPAEAHVYLALVRNGALSGSAVASVTGFPRSSVYLTLNSLLDKGLIEGGPGHGSRFAVVLPKKALPSLVVQEKEAIAQREEVRIYDGKLPHKLAIFDRKRALVHLTMPGDQMRTLYIDHLELAVSLGIAFDALWQHSEPLEDADEEKSSPDTVAIRVRKRTGSGQTRRSRKSKNPHTIT